MRRTGTELGDMPVTWAVFGMGQKSTVYSNMGEYPSPFRREKKARKLNTPTPIMKAKVGWARGRGRKLAWVAFRL